MVKNRKYLFLSVFLCGMTVLAVEFTASRMLQTVYGTSNIVWANVIGLTLLFLTMGYFIGGWLADRYPRPLLFYGLITAAGFSSIFFLLLTSLILRTTTLTLTQFNAGAIIGSFAGVFMAIAVPVTLLGCISPFAIRLGVPDVEHAGRISGRIYAISTWGSLLGTYLPVLWIIPVAGSRITAVIFGAVLLVVGLIGIWQEAESVRPKAAAAVACLLLIPFVVAWTPGGIKQTPGQVFETESPYNYIEVIKNRSCYYLFLNEGAAIHSFYCDDGSLPPQTSVYRTLTIAPLFAHPEDFQNHPVQNVAIVGLGAGTIAKLMTRVYGEMRFDGIELDPKIVDVGRKYFDMNEPELNVHVGDGRYKLNKLAGGYDVVVIDAYKPPYIPWHLTTVEYFEEVKSKLNESGSIAINVYRPGRDRRLVNAMVATLMRVFPSIYTIDARGDNTIIVATVKPTRHENVQQNFDALVTDDTEIIPSAMEVFHAGLKPLEPSDVIFTDQVAPVEPLIDSMVLRQLRL
ncbi:spermidine synthase [Desulfatitalea alkaliphila]|uniref:Fused MFS/spermidine synthase n=1 Tax=Desulfatitalea alkaliphila TaxID=2929485 RepID=A0AA41R691_9BACT|nr:fused MFS/spermidine synthase [Desulfatitalea alkaliphila]MCJ8501895.1 fused MFS/spermidine synthase [Desulfatitalea alkaliphila]